MVAVDYSYDYNNSPSDYEGGFGGFFEFDFDEYLDYNLYDYDDYYTYLWPPPSISPPSDGASNDSFPTADLAAYDVLAQLPQKMLTWTLVDVRPHDDRT